MREPGAGSPMAGAHQPLSQTVIRVACSRPESIMVPRLPMLAWALRVVSLREAR